MTFDTIVTVDWSGGNAKSARPQKDAIWVSMARDGTHHAPLYFRSRQYVEPWLAALMREELNANRRAIFGFDFAFGYPAGFGEALTGSADPFAVWRWFEEHVEDAPTSNNRFELAARINRMLGQPLFWGCPKSKASDHLSTHGRDANVLPFAEKRVVETVTPGAFTVWQLAYPGAVGSQVIMGLPVLERLRRTFPDQVSVWPFEPLDRPIAFVEVWPSLFNDRIAPRLPEHPIKDAVQVHVLTQIIAAMSPDHLARTLAVPPTPEGWIFGVAP